MKPIFFLLKGLLPAVVFSLILQVNAVSAEDKCAGQAGCRSGWVGLSTNDKSRISDFAENYKKFIAVSRTELTSVAEVLKLVKSAGFKPWPADEGKVVRGGRYYDVNRDRSIALIVVGDASPEEGLRIVGAHIDTPRLELKGRPLYGSGEFALFETSNHGGIVNFQWTNVPLALVGRIDKKDGSTVQVSVGLKPEDPVFIIPGLSPHVDKDLHTRTYRDAVALEELDPVVGHLPSPNGANVAGMVAGYLKLAYDIELADLVSAELALVPAHDPRDVGFDRALVGAYGQDDILSAYVAVRALLDAKTPKYTSVAWLVDNEEVGNVNNTGAASGYLKDLIRQIVAADAGDKYSELMLSRVMAKAKVVSADLNPGINPVWPSAWEEKNAPRLGYGVNLKLYGRGFNARSEYLAWFRNVLDQNNIPWQTATYKVGKAGGGTIGSDISDDNMDVIDIGIPLLSIHTPMSISSKVDIYNFYRTLGAFYAN